MPVDQIVLAVYVFAAVIWVAVSYAWYPWVRTSRGYRFTGALVQAGVWPVALVAWVQNSRDDPRRLSTGGYVKPTDEYRPRCEECGRLDPRFVAPDEITDLVACLPTNCDTWELVETWDAKTRSWVKIRQGLDKLASYLKEW